MTDEVLDLLIDKGLGRNSTKYINYRNEFIDIMKRNDYIETMDFTQIVPMIYRFTIDNNLKIDGNVLLLLLLMIVNDNNINKLKEKFKKKNNNLENYDYPRMIYYCDENNLYSKMNQHIKKYVQKHKTEQCLFNFIDKKYNFSDSDSDFDSD